MKKNKFTLFIKIHAPHLFNIFHDRRKDLRILTQNKNNHCH